MYKIIILLFCLLAQTISSAQFNDSVNNQVNYTSAGSINSANDGTAYLLNNALRYSMRKKDVRLNFMNSWVYGKQDDQITNNDFTSTLDLNLFKTFDHFYYWGLGNYTTSYSLKIDNQVQTGLGAAYNVIDKRDARFNISDGILYETSTVFVDDTVRDSYQTFRNSFRVQFRWRIKNLVSIDGVGFIQNSLNDKDDYILKANLNTSLKLMKWLSFTTSFGYNKVNKTRRENMLFTYGLTIEKYF